MSHNLFSLEERRLIALAIEQGHTFWGDSSLEALKRKIKNHLRQKQQECCCYCSRNIDDEFNMVLDIEHVIPKSEIVSEMFELSNLAVSCKRCNMRIKGDDVSFIEGSFEQFKASGNFYNSVSYKFIHPNLDRWDGNLNYIVAQVNRRKIVYYQVVGDSSKGQFTKDYFELDKIQVNTFDEAQEATGRKEPIDPAIAEEYLKLAASMLG
ncbi:MULTISPECIES: HNH endonuclease [Klebsiella pneumoniae complex]|uniref:HNH endonuclease n=1 Tax=Klebsiella pneumoniae complex TaxID=3390273 RepID=UPI000C1E325B|nr:MULTISPECIES: HNH endonuclease [Klebsiella]HCA9780230.1 HNH endonuclease [Klebsiella quasipneumoniae subsp. similipneumoniae]EJM0964737.1 HNH endonuclease [Klebsiella pneumoniae]MBK2445858.1 HNH endonuclease [Klebsiella pneumoniae]MCB3709527.1 HNH endonuclease [Klebsiella pneumoniae]MCX9856243.1 HNH endonuclease [Klebsiella pneumoniae]